MSTTARTGFEDPELGVYRPAELSDDEDQPRRGPSFTAILFFLAALVGGGVIIYAILVDRGRTQIPILVSGLTVVGVSLLVLALVGARGATGAGRVGHAGKALVFALAGGVCALGAAGSLGSAVVLALIWVSTGSTG